MSESPSDSEHEEVTSNLPYGKHPDWSDIKPIPQDDGPNHVVKIAYTDRFRETFDYVRACMQANEMSERTLTLTADACELNPANYTVWCYRRQILKHLGSNLDEELNFVGEMIKRNPKNYQVWEHRRLIVERSSLTNKELKFIASILQDDSKNYHAWQYRQWVLRTFSLWSDELNYVDELLDQDIRNNSAWNQRYFVIAHTTGFRDDIVERELDYVEKRIQSNPDNESAWNYLRGIIRFRSLNLNDDRIWKFCQTLYENQFENEELHRQQWRFLLAFMVDLLINDDREAQRNDNKRKINDLCSKLISNVDPIRRKYWHYIQEQHTVD